MCVGEGGQDIYEARWRGEAYMKLKSDKQGEFDTFSKRGLRYIKLSGGEGKHYLKPENDVPYHVCLVSIARSLMKIKIVALRTIMILTQNSLV